jgi:hypothetical protein
MKVFLSWSGDLAKGLAESLHPWLLALFKRTSSVGSGPPLIGRVLRDRQRPGHGTFQRPSSVWSGRATVDDARSSARRGCALKRVSLSFTTSCCSRPAAERTLATWHFAAGRITRTRRRRTSGCSSCERKLEFSQLGPDRVRPADDKTMVAFQISINGTRYCESNDITVVTMVVEELRRRGSHRISLHAGTGDAFPTPRVETPCPAFSRRGAYACDARDRRDPGARLRPRRS